LLWGYAYEIWRSRHGPEPKFAAITQIATANENRRKTKKIYGFAVIFSKNGYIWLPEEKTVSFAPCDWVYAMV